MSHAIKVRASKLQSCEGPETPAQSAKRGANTLHIQCYTYSFIHDSYKFAQRIYKELSSAFTDVAKCLRRTPFEQAPAKIGMRNFELLYDLVALWNGKNMFRNALQVILCVSNLIARIVILHTT